MADDRFVLIVRDDQGNHDVVLCNSRSRAEGLRGTYEGSGVETYGILRVVHYAEVLLDRERYPR